METATIIHEIDNLPANKRMFIVDKICLCISPPLMAEYYTVLELADECGADFIITGNTNDFTFPLYKQTKIVTPKDYWENYKPV